MLHRLPPPKLLQVNRNAHTTTCHSERRTSTLHNYHYSFREARGIGSAGLKGKKRFLFAARKRKSLNKTPAGRIANASLHGEAFAIPNLRLWRNLRRRSSIGNTKIRIFKCADF